METGHFFPPSTVVTKKPLPLLAACGTCGLYKNCITKKMEPYGKGKLRVMVVGEAPGAEEDRRGVPFIGRAGQYLRQRTNHLGIDLDRDCVTTNALICRPPGNKIQDAKAPEYCRPNLLKAVQEFKPETIILLGYQAMKSVIGHLWKEDIGPTGRWVGWQIPCQTFNCWICPTYHPSYLMRQESQVLDQMFLDHLQAAFALEGRPWKEVPDFKSHVELIYDTKRASGEIRAMVEQGRPIAFDFETNMLKPDSPKSRIVCCSMSNGKRTIAYPWFGETVKATRQMLRSKVPKIASNMKFEDRWVQALLKTNVRNWHWDTMLAAHVIDNRPLITSIKFQAFTLLGQEAYDEHVRPFLESEKPGGYSENRIREADLEGLMLYCGLDSLLEWKVAHLQKRELKWR